MGLFLLGWFLSFRKKSEERPYTAGRIGVLALAFFVLFVIWEIVQKLLSW